MELKLTPIIACTGPTTLRVTIGNFQQPFRPRRWADGVDIDLRFDPDDRRPAPPGWTG